MKTKFLILFLFITTTVNAQQVHFEGTILDAQTNRPIPNTFVSIRLQPLPIQSDNSDKRFFYKADTTGKFQIITNKITDADSITISCLNYKTQVLRLKNIQPDHIIKLIAMVKPPRVNIGQPPAIPINVGSRTKSGKSFVNIAQVGYDVTMFMHGSQDIQGIINTVGFYVSDGRGDNKGDATEPFRIRIFKIDTAAGPGEELTKDIIIVSAKKSNTWFDIDISAYNIENPCDGFYVAFGTLDSGYYNIKKGASKVDNVGQPFEFGARPQDILMPRLGYAADEFELPRTYFSVNRSLENWTRHWEHDFRNNSYMIRATIMPPD
jgi:hypothetical protein